MCQREGMKGTTGDGAHKMTLQRTEHREWRVPDLPLVHDAEVRQREVVKLTTGNAPYAHVAQGVNLNRNGLYFATDGDLAPYPHTGVIRDCECVRRACRNVGDVV